MEKIVIASGYFNPVHAGHIDYLNRARNLGDHLVVIVNNDEQVKLKGSVELLNETERLYIIDNVKAVTCSVLSIDKDASVCKSIELICKTLGKNKYIFAKGGDRYSKEIPEAKVCKKLKIQIVDGLGEKVNSSSKIKEKMRK